MVFFPNCNKTFRYTKFFSVSTELSELLGYSKATRSAATHPRKYFFILIFLNFAPNLSPADVAINWLVSIWWGTLAVNALIFSGILLSITFHLSVVLSFACLCLPEKFDKYIERSSFSLVIDSSTWLFKKWPKYVSLNQKWLDFPRLVT